MPSGKLVDVAVQVLPADFVERALVSALEHGPEGFDAVRVHVAPDVLGGTMLDRLMPECMSKVPVCPVIVCVNCFAGLHGLEHEPGQRLFWLPT